MDLANWRATRKRRPRKQSIPLCADGPLMERLSALQRSTPQQRKGETPKQALDRWTTELDDVKADVSAATIHVEVQSISPDLYLELKDEHRPTDPEAIKRGDEWDGATFWPALFAVSLTDESPVSEADAPEFWEELTAAEQNRIKTVCWDLNETVPDLGFTKPDTATTAGIGPKSTTAHPEE